MLPKTSFAIQVIRSRYEGMISMFCSQCGAPMGDNDKFCGVCGAPNTEVPMPLPVPSRRASPSPSRSLRPSRL
ncbi:MAG: zinc-ribbon domain-containing protein [Collinsella sp.]